MSSDAEGVARSGSSDAPTSARSSPASKPGPGWGWTIDFAEVARLLTDAIVREREATTQEAPLE